MGRKTLLTLRVVKPTKRVIVTLQDGRERKIIVPSWYTPEMAAEFALLVFGPREYADQYGCRD